MADTPEARTVFELTTAERDAAVAAFVAAHKGEPNWGSPPDRAWMEGYAARAALREQPEFHPADLKWMRQQKHFADDGSRILYDTERVDELTHALTGDEGEEDSLTVLDRMARYVQNVWPGKTALAVLIEHEEQAQQPATPTAPPPSREGWKWVPVESTTEMIEAALPESNRQRKILRLAWHAMLAASPEPPPATGWMPIETAPKDGSLFLCWVSAVCYGESDEGQQYQQDVSQVDFCQWRTVSESPDGGYFDPCCGRIGDAQHVTHWLPLPPPPTEPGEQA